MRDDWQIRVCIYVTPAENKVLRELTWDGACNKVIAQRLHVTEDTVKSHLKSVMKKVPHIKDRCALATALLRNCIITKESSHPGVRVRVAARYDLLSATPPAGRQAPRLGRRYAALARQ